LNTRKTRETTPTISSLDAGARYVYTARKSNPRLLIYQGVCDNQENYTETLPATNRVIKPTNARREA
jgi:hypothetical protein